MSNFFHTSCSLSVINPWIIWINHPFIRNTSKIWYTLLSIFLLLYNKSINGFSTNVTYTIFKMIPNTHVPKLKIDNVIIIYVPREFTFNIGLSQAGSIYIYILTQNNLVSIYYGEIVPYNYKYKSLLHCYIWFNMATFR